MVLSVFTRQRAIFVLTLIVIAAGIGIYLRSSNRQEDPLAIEIDPRLEYRGPYRNIDPAVEYAPEQSCAECHADKARSFAQHPMGRSLTRVARADKVQHGPAVHNPFEALGWLFKIEQVDDRLLHERSRLDAQNRSLGSQSWQVDYILGSGKNGYAYLISQDGYLFESPISWYSQKQRFDLSPGFGETLLTGRSISPECFFCHANKASHVDGSLNHFANPPFHGYAIGCQRCHGPGSLHVESRTRHAPVEGPTDYTIVNPRHLDVPFREAVCQQCHLQGLFRLLRRNRKLYDFRPGLPLDAFWTVIVAPSEASDDSKAVDQVEQMYESRCFRAARQGQKMGCISCHDPHEHVPADRRIDHYRTRCLECHTQHGCSLPVPERLRQSPRDSCIDCHMPRYKTSDIPHQAATDHRIPRRPKNTEVKDDPAASMGATHEPVAFSFASGEQEDVDEARRDMAVARVHFALAGESSALNTIGQALPILNSAVQRDRRDLPAAEARAHALMQLNRPAPALEAFEAILAQAPNHELALVGAAKASELLHHAQPALVYWRRAVAVNPWAAGYRKNLAALLEKEEAWEQALPECDAWIGLDPFSAEARATRVHCLLALGKKQEARAEYLHVVALHPANLPELEIRYGRKLK